MSGTIVPRPPRVATCVAGPRKPGPSGRRRGAHLAPAFRAASPRQSARPAPRRQGHSLLIVEDHRHTRELYAEYMAFHGLEVATAADGHSALAQALADPPDVIVLDLMLPGIDGWETLRRLKADPRTAAIPVIVVTAHELRTLLGPAAEAAGADAFLVKPCLPERLAREVQRLLDRR